MTQLVPWRAGWDCGWCGGPAAAITAPPLLLTLALGTQRQAALHPRVPQGLPGSPGASGPEDNCVDVGVYPLGELTQWNHLNAKCDRGRRWPKWGELTPQIPCLGH